MYIFRSDSFFYELIDNMDLYQDIPISFQWRHMSVMTSRITDNSTVCPITIKKTSKIALLPPLRGESNGHRWIPITMALSCGKRLHQVMTPLYVCLVKLSKLNIIHILGGCQIPHDDVIKWEHFPRYWPFVRGIHRSPVNSPHKGQWRGALMFSWSAPE